DIDPVEGVQMIKMDHVILHVLHAVHDIADQFGGGRNLDAEGVLDGAARRERVHGGAHAANALAEGPRIARVAALEDDFKAADHRAGAPGIDDFAVLDFGLDAEVAFDAGDGINNNAFAHGGAFRG